MSRPLRERITPSLAKIAVSISGLPVSQASIHCALPLLIARLASKNLSKVASGIGDGFLVWGDATYAAKRTMIVPKRNRFILNLHSLDAPCTAVKHCQ